MAGSWKRLYEGTTPEIAPALDFGSLVAQTPELASLLEQVKQFSMELHLSPNTIRAYSTAFRKFTLWATPLGLPVLPARPEVVLLYIGHLRTVAAHPSVVTHARYAIEWAHKTRELANPLDHPVVTAALKGYRIWWAKSEHQAAPVKAHPLSIDEVLAMIDALPAWNPAIRGVPQGFRDKARELVRIRMKAELLVGWQLGRRLDELVRADESWVVDRGDTATFTSSHQKAKPLGFSNTLHMTKNPKLCAITALREWLAASQPYRFGNTQLFAAVGADAEHELCLYDYGARKLSKLKRVPHRNAEVLTPELLEAAYAADAHEAEVSAHRIRFQSWMQRAGIEAPDPDRRLSGHSLRRGLVTGLLEAGVDPASVAHHVGWSNIGLVHHYSDHISPDHPITRLGI